MGRPATPGGAADEPSARRSPLHRRVRSRGRVFFCSGGGTDMSDITEEMIEAGAMTLDERIPWDQHTPAGRAFMRLQAAAVLRAALAGRTVVQLPEPDGEDSDGDPSWSLRSKGGEVVAYLEEGAQPHVTAFDLRGSEGAPADVAEAYG